MRMLDDRGVVHLAPGREGSVHRRHPWLFAGSIAKVEGRIEAGDTVVVVGANGERLGRGAYSPSSQIRVRMWTFDPGTAVNSTLIRHRLTQAIAWRERWVLQQQPGNETDGARLCFAENDGLPGMIIDRYGDVVVLQPQSAGAERITPMVVEALAKQWQPQAIVVRADAEVRTLEGLPQEVRVAHGTLPAEVMTREHGMRFHVDVEHGHKTGFYLDQRDSRWWVRTHVQAGARVLNCFSFTGGFSVAALMAGASQVTSVDSSQPALDLLQRNLVLNGLDETKHTSVRADCVDELRRLAELGAQFDLVILDPPKFAPSAAHRERALRAYTGLMQKGLRVLAPGGMMATFSCSGAVSRQDFAEAAQHAAVMAKRSCAVVHELGHAACHPVSLDFPEGAYLKGLLLHARA
jgi:23S rRNA (cytosine1962-C5)-methyltransferase